MASALRVTTSNLRRLRAFRHAFVGTAHISSGWLAAGLDVGEDGSISPVTVDTRALLSVLETNIIDLDMPLMRRGTVPTCTVEFTEIRGKEIRNLHQPCAVVLNDFIFGVEGAATVDGGNIAGTRLLDRNSVFTDIFPPHICHSARSSAMYTFCLGFSDDHVGD